MKKQQYVLVFDSGIGGLTTLKTLREHLPATNFLYLSDHKNCPYGNKPLETIKTHVLSALQGVFRTHDIVAVVIACNTVTTSMIQCIRDWSPVPVIGTEPNLKEPQTLGFKDVTLLATHTTIREQRTRFLEISDHVTFHNKTCKNLAKNIEDYMLSPNIEKKQKILKFLKRKLRCTPKNHAITLGCTHYVFFKKEIEDMGYHCFDGNAGVAKRLANILHDLKHTSPHFDCNRKKLIFRSTEVKSKFRLKRTYRRYEKQK